MPPGQRRSGGGGGTQVDRAAAAPVTAVWSEVRIRTCIGLVVEPEGQRREVQVQRVVSPVSGTEAGSPSDSGGAAIHWPVESITRGSIEANIPVELTEAIWSVAGCPSGTESACQARSTTWKGSGETSVKRRASIQLMRWISMRS